MARRLFTALTLSALAFGAAACSGDDQPEVKVDDAKVAAWAGQLCDTLGAEPAKKAAPRFGQAAPVRRVKKGYLDYVDLRGAQLSAIQFKVQGVGAPPVTRGKNAYDTAIGNIDKAKGTVDGLRTDLQKLQTEDAKAFRAGLGTVTASLTKLDAYRGPVADYRGDKTLAAAFNGATSCKKYGF